VDDKATKEVQYGRSWKKKLADQYTDADSSKVVLSLRGRQETYINRPFIKEQLMKHPAKTPFAKRMEEHLGVRAEKEPQISRSKNFTST
jgi:hypothetical protein